MTYSCLVTLKDGREVRATTGAEDLEDAKFEFHHTHFVIIEGKFAEERVQVKKWNLNTIRKEKYE